jgi:hypothetical protein
MEMSRYQFKFSYIGSTHETVIGILLSEQAFHSALEQIQECMGAGAACRINLSAAQGTMLNMRNVASFMWEEMG